jgi:signal transduction histidine kinase/ActR/RegA family two-component response regulator
MAKVASELAGSQTINQALADAVSLAVSESLRPVAKGFGLLYALYSISHLLLLPADFRWPMSITAFVSAVGMFGLYYLFARWRPMGPNAHRMAAGMAFCVLYNSWLHLWLSRDVLQSTNFMLLLVGVGVFFLSTRWLLVALLIAFVAWFGTVWRLQISVDMQIHFGFGLFAASLLGGLAHIARKQMVLRLTRLHLRDEERAQALQASETRYRLLSSELEYHVQELDVANFQLEQAARLKDEFLASISHELRTPLTAVLGLAESLQLNTYGALNERQMNALSRIEKSGNHLLALINDILDVARLEAGKFSLELKPTDVDGVCRSGLALIEPEAARKSVHTHVAIDPQASVLPADERRLKQILVNLLSNAVKFTPTGGAFGLQVVGDRTQEVIHFTIWDTGIGIARENLPRLFKPFVQLERELSRKYDGSGLGLVLAYRMTEMHGGSLRLESTPNQGSRLTVSLPWPQDEPASPALPPPVKPDGGQSLILIVDDQELHHTALVRTLQQWGCQTVVAHPNDDILIKARTLRPDLLLVSLQLPGVNGRQMIQALRAEPTLQGVPLVVMAALVLPDDETQLLAAGATAYVPKPVGARKVADLVQQLVSIQPLDHLTGTFRKECISRP